MDIEKIIGTIDGNPYELYSLRCFLNELIEAGVDLSKNDYNLHPAFIAMEDTYRFNPAVPDSWLVERLFIGETRLEQIYGCYVKTSRLFPAAISSLVNATMLDRQ